VITEGEFKTLALWRLPNHGSRTQPRFVPLGISGVYNWRGTIGKTVGPNGGRLAVKGAIPDLDWIAWEGRRVVIAYDADVAKDLVRVARSEWTAHLRGRGMLVAFQEWDVTRGKGIDDHLALVGPSRRDRPCGFCGLRLKKGFASLETTVVMGCSMRPGGFSRKDKRGQPARSRSRRGVPQSRDSM